MVATALAEAWCHVLANHSDCKCNLVIGADSRFSVFETGKSHQDLAAPFTGRLQSGCARFTERYLNSRPIHEKKRIEISCLPIQNRQLDGPCTGQNGGLQHRKTGRSGIGNPVQDQRSWIGSGFPVAFGLPGMTRSKRRIRRSSYKRAELASSRSRMASYRRAHARPRLVPAQIWAPDSRAPGFNEKAPSTAARRRAAPGLGSPPLPTPAA